MNKGLTFIVIIMASIVLLSGCALNDLLNLIENSGDLNPKWDASFRASVFEQDLFMKDFIKKPDVPSYSTSVPLLAWPLNLEISQNLNGTAPIDVTTDLDGNGSNDIDFHGLYCDGASLKLRLWLTFDTDTTVLPISENEISLSQMKIEGVTYDIGPPVREGDYLAYYLLDFPSSVNNYFIDFGGDSSGDYSNFNIEEFYVTFLSGSATYPFVFGKYYYLNFEAAITIGDDFGIVGRVVNDVTLYEKPGDPITPPDVVENLNNFGFEPIVDSHIASNLNINLNFTCDPPAIPDPVSKSIVINSGELSYNALNDYWYVTGGRTTSDIFTINGNITDYPNFKMSTSVVLPSSAYDILLQTSDSVGLKINMAGDITFSF